LGFEKDRISDGLVAVFAPPEPGPIYRFRYPRDLLRERIKLGAERGADVSVLQDALDRWPDYWHEPQSSVVPEMTYPSTGAKISMLLLALLALILAWSSVLFAL
jgi:hypothetical protein